MEERYKNGVILEGRLYPTAEICPQARIRFVTISKRVIGEAEIAVVELLLEMALISDPPHVTPDNAERMMKALLPLIKPAAPPPPLTGQAAVDRSREVAHHANVAGLSTCRDTAEQEKGD